MKHIFATGSEAGRLHLWNAKLKMLKAKVNLHHPAVGCGFSPDGKHIAVGCKDGCLLILSYKNIVNGYFKQVVQRAKAPRCEFHHCNEAIDEVKYSPDGALLAAGSHDNFIDVYDVTGSAVPGRWHLAWCTTACTGCRATRRTSRTSTGARTTRNSPTGAFCRAPAARTSSCTTTPTLGSRCGTRCATSGGTRKPARSAFR